MSHPDKEVTPKTHDGSGVLPPTPATTEQSAKPNTGNLVVDKVRRAAPFFLKVVLAAALLTWLARSGRFKLSDTINLVSDPQLLVADLAAWSISGVLIATLRFRTLLRAIDIELPLGRGLALQLIALFFNIVVPGNVGGDVIKAIDVARAEPEERRAQVYLLVFMERIFGLMGLALLALLVIAVRAPQLFASEVLRPTAMVGTAVALGIILTPIAAALVLLKARPFALRLVGGIPPLARIVAKLVDGLELVATKRVIVAKAIALSMLNHTFPMLFFFLATRKMAAPDVDFGTIASIFPLGILTLALPISPGGLGVGHVAFDSLFSAVGLTGGAAVFNVFLLGQALPCVVGVVPYLLLKRRSRLTATAQG